MKQTSGASFGTSLLSVISCFQLVLFFHLSGFFTWVLLDRCVYVSAAECVVLPATATFKRDGEAEIFIYSTSDGKPCLSICLSNYKLLC